MEENRTLHVSGHTEPNTLMECLQKAEKIAHLVHWQYGECPQPLMYQKSDHNLGLWRVR